MMSYLRDKAKYLREPYRLRVHVGYGLLLWFTATARPRPTPFLVGSGMIVLGILIRAWASGIVQKDEQLATEGPYSLCRDPLYVGNFLIGFGFTAVNGQLWSAGVLVLYLLLFYPPTLRKETRKMREFFGEAFEQYRREVPRFWPRLTPYRTLGGWSFRQYFLENKDYVNEGAVLLCWLYTVYLYLGG